MTLRRRGPCFLFLFLCLIATSVAAADEETWRSELYPADWAPPAERSFEEDRLIQDFSYAGYQRGERPIPDVAGPVHDVRDYGADAEGNEDATAAIQQAIDAAGEAGGGVVHLPEGRYRVSADDDRAAVLRIAHDGVVLRGDGPGRTFIENHTYQMRRKAVIDIAPPDGQHWRSAPADAAETRITRDLLSPTKHIPVESVSGFAVGDWVVLRADASEAFIDEHGMSDYWGGYEDRLGGVAFYRRITAIDENSPAIAIDVPTRYYLKTRDRPRVHHTHRHLEEVGVEDLSIGNREHPADSGWGMTDYERSGRAAHDVHASYLVRMGRVRNGWVRRVESFRPEANELDVHMLSNGLITRYCRGVTIKACRFERGQYGGGGGNGYMIRLTNTNETLVIDSHVSHNRHGFVVSHMASSGNVFHGGSASVTGWQGAGNGRTSGRGSDHHMHLSQSSLLDSITLDRDWVEARYRGRAGTIPHAISSAHTVFWNIRGEEYFGNVDYVVHSAQARYGYVIGTQGPAHGVRLSGPDATRPRDHVEGVGEGETLDPPSLYQDQLRRRLQRLDDAADDPPPP